MEGRTGGQAGKHAKRIMQTGLLGIGEECDGLGEGFPLVLDGPRRRVLRRRGWRAAQLWNAAAGGET